jgi:hypothetical protein
VLTPVLHRGSTVSRSNRSGVGGDGEEDPEAGETARVSAAAAAREERKLLEGCGREGEKDSRRAWRSWLVWLWFFSLPTPCSVRLRLHIQLGTPILLGRGNGEARTCRIRSVYLVFIII